ncbi:hypothetical protein F5B21DRAFT_370774 [Xylaria acuta]|nr:hypothetical protein F5B21DRAFT_370774 [Xylaria acuta]
MQDGKCPGPEIHSPLRPQEYLSEYSIEAIGRDGKHTNGHPEDKDRRCGRYLVCFNSADKLANFVKENDQRALKCRRKLGVFETDHRYIPVDRKAIASTREKNKENLDKEREDDLGADFVRNTEDTLIQPIDLPHNCRKQHLASHGHHLLRPNAHLYLPPRTLKILRYLGVQIWCKIPQVGDIRCDKPIGQDIREDYLIALRGVCLRNRIIQTRA